MEESKNWIIFLPNGAAVWVDEQDYSHLVGYSWRLTEGYACRSGGHGKPRIRMHREITGATPGQEVDHINGNKLDNRRSNLRLCTHAENLRNRKKWSKDGHTRFKGIRQTKPGTWIAQIGVNGRTTYIGTFRNEEDAARAYDERALAQYGSFARLNFPLIAGAA
jgi:hypothetical protein